MSNTIRILGLDPGLRRCGWGVLASTGARLTYVSHGVICPDEKAPFADRLLALFDGVTAVVETWTPDEAAIEDTFVNVNPTSTLKLGHARAAAMLAPAKLGLTVAEYTNAEVKKAVVGTGGADKNQVGFMIRRLLPAAGDVSADAADALAVAVLHAHSRRLRRAA